MVIIDIYLLLSPLSSEIRSASTGPISPKSTDHPFYLNTRSSRMKEVISHYEREIERKGDRLINARFNGSPYHRRSIPPFERPLIADGRIDTRLSAGAPVTSGAREPTTFAPTGDRHRESARQNPDNEVQRGLGGRRQEAGWRVKSLGGVAQLCKAPRGLPRTMNVRALRPGGRSPC